MLSPLRKQKRPVTVIGSAVIDVIADAYALPWRGCDIELQQQSVNIGGCALNVAVALKRLGIEACNALPLGQGVWADIVRNNLQKQDINSVIETDKGDNGWCLALVEPDGERTFMSFTGVENAWTDEWLARLPRHADGLVYLSGYQLTAACADLLIGWLESTPGVTALIDFGPRIADISPERFARIMACKPLITLNRQEAEIVAEVYQLPAETEALGKAWLERWHAPLIVRQDKDGAWYFSEEASGHAMAFPATVVDTIGAGDSHAGGVLAGLAFGSSLAEAVTLGNAVASWVVSHRGGDCAPTAEELLLAHKHV
ncbi:PfkB family carbohydrate kinase [Enterobacter sp. CC120223-11]|uniref:PfkB family carbohydrate kinase n=1 Tax=Enterobacter sp. CC120223-11 TaxID=1378073 RepID=UPI000BD847BB|nr:PfkB family carbohydrate kinase [Enterobacter sp. CC120223-11]SNY63870.1 Sugar or nucleoside kinase, ribokinase family [Enterobacter sp. CC120223-11]